jgi:hypothetical protein
MSWLKWSGKAAGKISAIAASETAIAVQAAAAIAACRTPAGVIAVQTSFATAWFARAMSHVVALGSLTLQSQDAAMAPLHRAATANARRLNR